MQAVANIIKLFLGIVYATSSIFPYDFDWGYANSDVIMSKIFYNIGHRAQCYLTFMAVIYKCS
jgi:hypothetical protein